MLRSAYSEAWSLTRSQDRAWELVVIGMTRDCTLWMYSGSIQCSRIVNVSSFGLELCRESLKMPHMQLCCSLSDDQEAQQCLNFVLVTTNMDVSSIQ